MEIPLGQNRPVPPRPGAGELVRLLGLTPLPGEGGLFVRTYCAEQTIGPESLPPAYGSPRPLATAILYLLTPESKSALHRLPADEIFHFYLGDPVRMLNLHPKGRARRVLLGPDIPAGQAVQWVVPAGTWQGCRLEEGGEYALLGATMAPGFDWPDLELARPGALAADYPGWEEEIASLEPEPGEERP